MTKNSIDLQPLPQEKQESAQVRHSFRVPISSKDNILAVIHGRTYSVANVSATGIAIHSDSCLEFESGQILEEAELWLGTQRLTGLTGKVIHCSVHASGNLQFGIAWQKMDDEDQAVLNQVIDRMKTAALEANQLSPDSG